MMMHDVGMKSYYILVGEMNMDWIEVRISITFDMHHIYVAFTLI